MLSFETEEIISINKIDEDSLIIVAHKIRIIKFEENQPKNIKCEII